MSKTSKAIALQSEAAALRTIGRPHDHIHARTLENQATDVLRLDTPPVMALGEALPGEFDDDRVVLYNTLENPDGVSVEASTDRLELLIQAGALEMGLDLATTIGASNSLEKTMAHQMAALHKCGLRMLSKTEENPNLPTADLTRLVNAATRCFDSFATTLATLQTLRTGGRRQKIVVQHQHIHVNDGAQAAIVGQIQKGEVRGD